MTKFNSDSGESREMHKAVCSECGKKCEVPFKPTEGKKVFCKECYRGRAPRRNNFGPRETHKAVCSECGKECEVPFKPSGDKPVYCKECFAKKREMM